jgi:predicted exporter
MRLSEREASIAAVAAGVFLWIATSLATGRREAWDSGMYWIAAYPAGIIAAAALGFLAPRRAWRRGLLLMLAQAAALAATAADFSMLPLGLILFSMLAVPPIAAAVTAGWFGRKRLVDSKGALQ